MDKTINSKTKANRQPFFSVIIPMHNAGELIEKCLYSVYAQDLEEEDFEIIVVDDCSTDNSVEIATTYAENHANTTLLLHKENKRQGGARNTAMRAARGKYFAFMDSDDCWQYTNTLSTFKRIITETNADIVDNREYTRIAYNADAAMTTYSEEAHYQRIENISLLRSNDFLFAPWCAICKRELIYEHKIWFAEKKQYEDADWRMKTVYYANNIVRTAIPFYCYRLNPSSTLNKIQPQLQFDAVSLYKRLATFASGDIHHEMKGFLSLWLLRNVISFPFLSQRYRLQDSRKAVTELRQARLLDSNTYKSLSPSISFKKKEIMMLFLLNHTPFIALAPYRAIMKLKNAARRLACKRKRH